MRRIGVNRLYKGSDVISPAYVVLQGDRVADYGEIGDEMPMTEWLGGYAFLSSEPEHSLSGQIHACAMADAVFCHDSCPRHVFHVVSMCGESGQEINCDSLVLLEEDEFLF